MTKLSIQVDILPMLIPIQKDVDIFLYRFAQLKPCVSSSFIAFKTIWDDMHLHLIYSCQTTEELFIFQDLLLDTVKHRLFPPYASLWNLGAIYLLFAFLELVPFRRHLSIIRARMTRDDLMGVQKLMRYLRVEEEAEASVILLYILEKHCVIVAYPMSDLYTELRKQYSHRYSNHSEQVDLKNAAHIASTNLSDMTLETYIADQLESFGFLNKMAATNKHYCAMKALTPDVRNSSLCSLIGRNLISNFADPNCAVQHESLSAMDANIGTRREVLKSKAFAKDSSHRTKAEDSFVGPRPKKLLYDGPNKGYRRRLGGKIPVLENISVAEKLEKSRYECRYRNFLNERTTKSSLKLKRIAKKIKKVDDTP